MRSNANFLSVVGNESRRLGTTGFAESVIAQEAARQSRALAERNATAAAIFNLNNE